MVPLTVSESFASRRNLAAAILKVLPVCVLALLIYYALFQLPFYFPPRERLMSASYTYGFNNSIAILLTAGLLGGVTLWYLLCRPDRMELPIAFTGKIDGGAPFRSTRKVFAVLSVSYVAATFALYLYNVHSAPWLMWETRHLLHRTWLMDLYGLRPYSQIAAEYGPILTYAPSYMFLVFGPLGASHEQAYFASVLVLNLAGLWCAYYVLSRAQMPAAARLVALVLLAITGFAPYMGVNGVLVRYLFPFASLLLGHRLTGLIRLWRGNIAFWSGAVALVLLLLLTNILLSPEIGVAFVLTWLGYAALMWRIDARILASSLIAIVATVLICWLCLPAAYYETLLRFSEGANNLPLLPAPHLVLYLTTVFLVVPPLLAVSVRERRTGDLPGAAICGAMGLLCIVIAPGALGRCDPPHVLLYGLGASMLLMIRLANVSRRQFMTYAVAYAAVFIVFFEMVNLLVFYGVSPKVLLSPHPLATVMTRLKAASATSHPDVTTLSALDRYPRLGLPFASYGDSVVEKYVITSGKLKPEYYVSIVGVYTRAALQRKLHDVEKMEYLLVPRRLTRRGIRNPCAGYLKSLRQWFLYPANLPCRADPLDPEMALRAFIADHYRPVEQIGSWEVLRKVPTASILPPVSRYLSAL
jgi:hypothetical protein